MRGGFVDDAVVSCRLRRAVAAGCAGALLSTDREGAMLERISVEALRGVGFAFEDDVYSVAHFLLRFSDANDEKSKGSGMISRSRPTLRGVAAGDARPAFDVSSDAVCPFLADAGLPLGAIVEYEGDVR